MAVVGRRGGGGGVERGGRRGWRKKQLSVEGCRRVKDVSITTRINRGREASQQDVVCFWSRGTERESRIPWTMN